MGSGDESFINGPGHMIKMAAMHRYMVKTIKNLLLQNQKSYDLETWPTASGPPVHFNLIITLSLGSIEIDHVISKTML